MKGSYWEGITGFQSIRRERFFYKVVKSSLAKVRVTWKHVDEGNFKYFVTLNILLHLFHLQIMFCVTKNMLYSIHFVCLHIDLL